MTTYIAKQPDSTGHIPFTEPEHQVWQQLILRQRETIKGRACQAFIDGLEQLNLPDNRIPTLAEVNAGIRCTSWQVVPVTGTIGIDRFFAMLARREFPVATFIRIPEELDYLQQPDIFHEIYGHCPMLTNPAYADFMAWYGEFAAKQNQHGREMLSRLFWFTIEFGLVDTTDGMRIFGGGILSSHQETLYAIDSTVPARTPLDLETVLATLYRHDIIQTNYFFIPDMDYLYQLMDETLLTKALANVQGQQPIAFETC